MHRSERAIFTVLCLICDGKRALLQQRVKDDWRGLTLPGGHVEPGESFVAAVVREMKEETGLDIRSPRLVGVKQFPTDDAERYVVLLFRADEFSGEVVSSDEGEMRWVPLDAIAGEKGTVADLELLLRVFTDETLTEFVYEREGELWRPVVY